MKIYKTSTDFVVVKSKDVLEDGLYGYNGCSWVDPEVTDTIMIIGGNILFGKGCMVKSVDFQKEIVHIDPLNGGYSTKYYKIEAYILPEFKRSEMMKEITTDELHQFIEECNNL